MLGLPGSQHSWLKKPGKGYISSFMPEHIINAYHDSGYNPKSIKQDFTTWITPGSYIDPAGRDKPNMPGTAKFPENGQSIIIDLDSFGFPDTSFNATMLPNDDECQVIITIPGAVVNITRNSQFESNTEPDYFCGNPQKNLAINQVFNNADGRTEIKKYVISKELSDFSQILFAIINMIRIFGRLDVEEREGEIYKHCVFTTDNVVAARSKFMGIQSCLQDHAITADSSYHRAILYLGQMDPYAAARELRTTYLNACIKNNNTVKAHIARAIIQGLYIDPQDRIQVIGNIKNYLHKILESIDIATALAQVLPLDGAEHTDVYKKEILNYYAKTPINEKGRIVQSLQRLYVSSSELRGIDPIYNTEGVRKTFGQQIQEFIRPVGRTARRKTRKFLNLRKMKGGARSRVFSDEEIRSLIGDEIEHPWNLQAVHIERGSLLDHMRLIIGADESDFEDFIFRAFNHLLYICETPLDDRLLIIYNHIDIIENLELEQFMNDYNSAGFRNAQFFAVARARLVAAREEDPMEMLADTPLSSEEVAEEQADTQEIGEQPVGEQPVGEQPVGEQPVWEQPVWEQPVGEQIVENTPPIAGDNGGYETNVYIKPQIQEQSPKAKKAIKAIGTYLPTKMDSRIQKSLNLRKKARNERIRTKRFGRQSPQEEMQQQMPQQTFVWARKTRKGRK